MDKKLPLATAATAFAATLAAAPLAQAADNPFALVEYRGALHLAADKGEMSCGGGGEMKCGASADPAKGGAGKDGAETQAGGAPKTEAPANPAK